MKPLFFMSWDGERVVPEVDVVVRHHEHGFGRDGRMSGKTYHDNTGARLAPVFTPSTRGWWSGGDGYKYVARETATGYLGRMIADP